MTGTQRQLRQRSLDYNPSLTCYSKPSVEENLPLQKNLFQSCNAIPTYGQCEAVSCAAITAMHVFVLGASDTEPTIGTLVTLLSALLKTTQCRHDPRGSEQQQLWWSSRTNNIPQLESHEAYQCYADHGYFTDTRFIDGNVPDARFVLNTRRIDNWVASMHHRLPQRALRKANCSSFPDCPHQVESLLYARVQKVMWLSGELNRHFQSRDNFIAMRVEDFESLSHGAFIHKTSALALALALVLALEH